MVPSVEDPVSISHVVVEASSEEISTADDQGNPESLEMLSPSSLLLKRYFHVSVLIALMLRAHAQ